MAVPEAQTDDITSDDSAEIESLRQEIGKTPAPADKPKPETEAKPEVKAEADDNDEESVEVDNKGKFVRHGAFHQERERRKAAEAARKDLEARYASDMTKANERLAALFEKAQATKEPPKAEVVQLPDPEKDPFGYLKARADQLEKQNKELQDFRQSATQQTEQQKGLANLQRVVLQREAEFRATSPDYDDAYTHMQNIWAQEANIAGVDPQQAIAARIIENVRIAAQSNKNPAEVLYNRAKLMGYAKKEPAADDKVAKGQSDMERLAKGIAGAKSPSATPGSTAPGAMTIEALVAMGDDEFAEQFGTKDYDKKRRAILGLA